MVVIKVLVQVINISVISVNALQRGLDDSQRDNLYDSSKSIVRKLGEKEIVVITVDCKVTLDVMEKTVRTSTEVLVMELRARRKKQFLSFVQL